MNDPKSKMEALEIIRSLQDKFGIKRPGSSTTLKDLEDRLITEKELFWSILDKIKVDKCKVCLFVDKQSAEPLRVKVQRLRGPNKQGRKVIKL